MLKTRFCQRQKKLTPEQPATAVSLSTITLLFHFDSFLCLVIDTQLLVGFDGFDGKYSEIIYTHIAMTNNGVDCDIGIARVIKKTRYIAVMHCVDRK
jgi:hypothetical protein